MDALHKLVSFQSPASSVIPHFLVLTLLAIFAGWVLARSLRFQ